METNEDAPSSASSEIDRFGHLMAACADGHLDEVQKLVSLPEIIGRLNEDSDNGTPIEVAARGGHGDICFELIKAGAEVHETVAASVVDRTAIGSWGQILSHSYEHRDDAQYQLSGSAKAELLQPEGYERTRAVLNQITRLCSALQASRAGPESGTVSYDRRRVALGMLRVHVRPVVSHIMAHGDASTWSKAVELFKLAQVCVDLVISWMRARLPVNGDVVQLLSCIFSGRANLNSSRPLKAPASQFEGSFALLRVMETRPFYVGILNYFGVQGGYHALGEVLQAPKQESARTISLENLCKVLSALIGEASTKARLSPQFMAVGLPRLRDAVQARISNEDRRKRQTDSGRQPLNQIQAFFSTAFAFSQGGQGDLMFAASEKRSPPQLDLGSDTSDQAIMLRFRRAVEAKRDAAIAFKAASEGRPMELAKRIKLGVLAGGLEAQGPIHNNDAFVAALERCGDTGRDHLRRMREASSEGELIGGPMLAAAVGGHAECVRILAESASRYGNSPIGTLSDRRSVPDAQALRCKRGLSGGAAVGHLGNSVGQSDVVLTCDELCSAFSTAAQRQDKTAEAQAPALQAYALSLQTQSLEALLPYAHEAAMHAAMAAHVSEQLQPAVQFASKRDQFEKELELKEAEAHDLEIRLARVRAEAVAGWARLQKAEKVRDLVQQCAAATKANATKAASSFQMFRGIARRIDPAALKDMHRPPATKLGVAAARAIAALKESIAGRTVDEDAWLDQLIFDATQDSSASDSGSRIDRDSICECARMAMADAKAAIELDEGSHEVASTATAAAQQPQKCVAQEAGPSPTSGSNDSTFGRASGTAQESANALSWWDGSGTAQEDEHVGSSLQEKLWNSACVAFSNAASWQYPLEGVSSSLDSAVGVLPPKQEASEPVAASDDESGLKSMPDWDGWDTKGDWVDVGDNGAAGSVRKSARPSGNTHWPQDHRSDLSRVNQCDIAQMLSAIEDLVKSTGHGDECTDVQNDRIETRYGTYEASTHGLVDIVRVDGVKRRGWRRPAVHQYMRQPMKADLQVVSAEELRMMAWESGRRLARAGVQSLPGSFASRSDPDAELGTESWTAGEQGVAASASAIEQGADQIGAESLGFLW